MPQYNLLEHETPASEPHLNNLIPLLLWFAAQLGLTALLWPAAVRLSKGSLFAQAHSAVALAGFCVLAGTLLSLACRAESRLLLAIAPFLIALPFLAFGLPRWRNFSAEGALVLFFTIACATITLLGLSLPAFHYDGLLYHLPSSALAWQQQTFFPFAAHPQIGSNPMLAELPKVWSFAFSGNDSLAHLQQLPALAGLLFLTFELCRRYGRSLAVLSALALLLVPKVFEQGLSANVDLLAGFWGASAVLFLSRRNLGAAAGALLVFAQLKYTTLPPAALGALWLLVLFWKRRKALAIGWAVLFLTLGGFWEWQSFARRGNPTYPYQILSTQPWRGLAPRWIVAEADPRKWDGYYVNKIESAANGRGWSRHALAWLDLAYVPYDELSGRWGPYWKFLFLPSLLFFLIQRRRRRPGARALAIALLFYLATPKSWETRFGILLLPFGLALIAWAAHELKRRFRLKHSTYALAFCLLVTSMLEIWRSHPFPVLQIHSTPLALATREPEARLVEELAAAVNEAKPATLWIDFTRGPEHHYGMAGTLLYPYFSRDWSRRVTITESESLEQIASAGSRAVLLQKGSKVPEDGLRLLGYRELLRNSEGVLYAR